MDPSGNGRRAPIKVLRVIARLNVGGPALHVSYLSRGLATRGYETTLVAGDVAKGEESMAWVAEEEGVEVMRLPGLSREISPLHDLRSILWLSRLIREQRPEILHTHTAKAGAVGRIAALLAGGARPPVVVHTFHGHVLRGYFGRVSTLAFKLVERALAARTDALVAVSPEVASDLVAIGIATRKKFVVVRLGIELARRVSPTTDGTAARALVGIPQDRFLVGWFGRMTAVKRTQDLVDVLAGLHRRGVQAHLLLVGDGIDRERLEERAFELGLARHCTFLGYQNEVSRWFAACDAVALTSENEGTPVTVIEALAAGRAVVAYGVGGVTDVLRDGVDGFIVAPRDTDRMADRLAELARDPELRSRLGATGRASVARRYAVERLVQDVDTLYRALLAGRSSRNSDR
jgi:glycosyltransferase involved in cell wall biosynthesis